MKVLVDARWMTGRVRGMGRYALQLVAPIESRCLFATAGSSSDVQFGHSIRRGTSFFPIWEQWILPSVANDNPAEWLLCPYNTAPLMSTSSAKLILVVHDLIYLEPWSRLPPSISLYQNLGRLYRRFVVPRVIRRAHYLLTVSEYTKQLMVERYAMDPSCISVIPNSLDNSWFNLQPVSLCERENYIFTVAGEAPSKNVKCMLQAYALYAKQVKAPRLLRVVGITEAKHGAFIRICKKLGVEKLVNFVGYLSDAELKAQYLGARAFIFPSLYEGFGIPLLEAMATGVPIICSNTTSLPEVVGQAALQFDPRRVDDMALCIKNIVEDEFLANDLIIKGYQQVTQFRLENIEARFKQFWSDLEFTIKEPVN